MNFSELAVWLSAGDVAPLEVTFALVSIPGALYWARNWFEASRTLRDVEDRRIDNGRREYARYSTLSSRSHTLIQVAFTFMAFFYMLTPAPPTEQGAVSRLVNVSVFVGTSILLTYLAYRLRRVDRRLIKAAVADLKRERDLTSREDTATIREGVADERALILDDRAARISERSERLDERPAGPNGS